MTVSNVLVRSITNFLAFKKVDYPALPKRKIKYKIFNSVSLKMFLLLWMIVILLSLHIRPD